MYDKLNEAEKKYFLQVAENLGVNPDWLYNLISFESNWDPQASNSKSSAKGLIQWVDTTAVEDGFSSSYDLISRNPDIISQLPIVYRRLSRYAPFGTEQELYMSVFYPAARLWPFDKQFPDSVKRVNPGISTPQDYINFVNAKIIASYIPLVAIGAMILYSFSRIIKNI